MKQSELPVRARASLERPKRKILDWLSHPHLEDLTAFQKFVVNLDWSKSLLGPISTWTPQLRQMVLLVMSDPTPAVVYWGDEATIVYNEAYTQLIGRKHPALQGHDPKVGFAEVWDHFENLLSRQRETGETTIEANAFLLLFRHGFLEETYFNWKFVPIIGLEGWVVGSHATVVEVTREVISDRRLSTVRALGRELSGASTIEALWQGIVPLEVAEKDIPLALIYSVCPGESKGISPSSVPPTPSLICCLEASVGIEKGHVLSSARLAADTDLACILPYFVEAMETMSSVIIPIKPEISEILKNITWRGFGVPSTSVVVCPISPINSKIVFAFLVLALNPRRLYDEDHKGFVHLLTQQVTTPQLSAIILREEVERRQQRELDEALDRERLHKELSESELKFARFVTRAPIGLGMLKPDGTAMSANDLWQDLTQLGVGTNQVDWANVLVVGELDHVLSAWGRLMTEKNAITMQTRIRRPWKTPELDQHGKEQFIDTHILLSMHPDIDENGDVTTVMSCITDITSLKWSESQLQKRMDQATEMKKQQERFVDMTSHEMRNPLSALIGCADEIIASLNEYRSSFLKTGVESPGIIPENLSLVEEAVEAANTIIYCAMHQKRIIDDILTLSRLDSNLLLVSPAPSQPIHLVRNALKMFEVELKRADTTLDFIEEESLQDLQIEWTLLDPSRVLQVLINLLTNAIKFTRTEAQRNIVIKMGASLTKPSKANEFGVEYVQKSTSNPDQTEKAEWGDGEFIYLSFAVADTGRGLSGEEKKNLFHLFKQASPKTYNQYGGSGLGLFISRQLVEMQGGEIGVASEAGRGSTFQFYVKTRRTTHCIDSSQKADFQLLVREDALREACVTETPTLNTRRTRSVRSRAGTGSNADELQLQNGTKMPNIQLETIRPLSPPTHSPSSHFNILVVEDNLVNQKVLLKQLRRAGHVVSVANHGEEALDFIRRSEHWHDFHTPSFHHPSLHSGETERGESLSVVLMDVEMPVMDGITCVRKIRELQRLGKIRRHIPIVAVTANARKDQIDRSLEAGMDDVTTKPYRLQDMLKQIERLVAKLTTLDATGGGQVLSGKTYT